MRVALFTDANRLGYKLSILGMDETLNEFATRGMKPIMEGRWGEICFAHLTAADAVGTCIEIWD